MSFVRMLGFVTLLLGPIAAVAPADAAGIKLPDQDFQFHAEWVSKGEARLGWAIAPGHYFYRDLWLANQLKRTERGEPAATASQNMLPSRI
jgi:hypothetical protein